MQHGPHQRKRMSNKFFSNVFIRLLEDADVNLVTIPSLRSPTPPSPPLLLLNPYNLHPYVSYPLSPHLPLSSHLQLIAFSPHIYKSSPYLSSSPTYLLISLSPCLTSNTHFSILLVDITSAPRSPVTIHLQLSVSSHGPTVFLLQPSPTYQAHGDLQSPLSFFQST